MTVSPRQTKLQLRLQVEEALRQRRPTAFYIDEAQNLGKVVSGRKLQDQTDCIKSLANICNVQFLLVGTYELLLLRNLSGQLCRRSTDIHFPRYRAELPQDLRSFMNVVHTFQRHLPLEEQPDLVSYWDFCYERSIGCVGILKDWLSRTLAVVLKRNDKAATLTLEDLEHHAWSLDQCMVMLAEAKEEEKKLDSSTARSDLRAALGLEPVSTPETNLKPVSQRKRRTAVGKPLPKRRPVGEPKNAS